MKILIKQLQGREVTLEVNPSTSILEMKQQIENELKIPVESQRLLFLGRALVDELPVSFYPHLKEGTKLNLAVKKPDGLYEVSMKKYKKQGMSDAAAAQAANRLLVTVREKFEQLSMDDVDKLALDFMQVRDGVPRPDTQRPDTQLPDTQRPYTQRPETQRPDTKGPDTQSPNTQRPDTQSPDTQRPDTQCSDTQRPDTQHPDTQLPGTQHPGTQRPGNQLPGIQRPHIQRPDIQRPHIRGPTVS